MSSSPPELKNKPKASAFRQQKLKAWQPILTPVPVITFFILIGVVFIPLGAILLTAAKGAQEFPFRYDNFESCRSCNQSGTSEPSGKDDFCELTNCTVKVPISEDMEPPIYVYYKLNNYYQNHRRYVKSRSDAQLRGEVVSYSDVETPCSPIVSANGEESDDAVYLPCGLIAWSYFNDTFSVAAEGGGNAINLTEKGIAWPSDLEYKFKPYPDDAKGTLLPETADTIGRDFANEHFVVWMRTAALPSFKKLYAIINEPIVAGTYEVQIQNQYPVYGFEGQKFIVFATTSWLGGRNPFLGYSYIVVGSISFFQGILFLIKHVVSPRRVGDTSFLKWVR